MAGTLIYVSSQGESGRADIPAMVAQHSSAEADVVEADVTAEVPPESPMVASTIPVMAIPAVAPVPRLLRPNESFVTYYTAETGTVVVDTDPDGEAPTVLWHFQDEDQEPMAQEDGQI